MLQWELIILLGLLYLLAYLVVIFGGSYFVGHFLNPYKSPETNSDSTGLQGVGKKIGKVERAIILTLALLGEFGAISFVFVAKSMARFEQLKKRQFAEYYLLGTLLSILFALFIALILQGIITILANTYFPDIQNLWN
ncbi:MAG: hypothetical protein ACTSSO_02505 [Candidatus Hodarchaeales archaeon]